MFRHKLQENGGNVACPIASEYNTGLRPSPTNPQLNKTSMDSKKNCFMNFAKNEQFKAPKHINGEPNNQRKLYLLVGSELKREKRSKTQQRKLGGCCSCNSRELGSF